MAASIGGQAVLEGVMMRGPSSWAVAVRRPDGRISEIVHDVASVAVRRRWLRLPIIRGIVALGESLTIGFKALAISANFATTDEGEEDASEGIGQGLHHRQLRCRDPVHGARLQGVARAPDGVDRREEQHLLRADRGRAAGCAAGRLPGADLAAARPPARLRVPRGRAQGDQRVRGGRRSRARDRAAVQPHPRALRHRVPAVGDGRRDRRLRRCSDGRRCPT